MRSTHATQVMCDVLIVGETLNWWVSKVTQPYIYHTIFTFYLTMHQPSIYPINVIETKIVEKCYYPHHLKDSNIWSNKPK
jgi:hypothetical protein